MINRQLYVNIAEKLHDKKAINVMGSRQVGKTTLLRSLEKEIDKPCLWWNGDEPDIRNILTNSTSSQLKSLIGDANLLIIDEAQRIENIGISLKLIVDSIPNLKVIATGSSSFDLANKINEPLTGRKWEFMLYPISVQELISHHGLIEEKRLLDQRLIYGFYPDVITQKGQQRDILLELTNSLLYKDIFTLENIKKPTNFERLVQALAFQIGQEVSINELSQISGLDFHTVERYISLLEKSYVIFQLSPFSRNLRNEIKKSRKIYFFDNGVRNSVIKQFSTLELRNDVGALWENFLMAERQKVLEYNRIATNRFFWRNHAQQEIDYIEERNGEIHAFEFKWNPKAKARFSKSFTNAYNPTTTSVIHRDNYLSFIQN
ncbi:MAG: ATP-binding protein [bacterium]|nr:ATP-binding protein [bacterium]